jgi:predicted nucleic acid-binding protein
MTAAMWYYWDASALVKVVAIDPDESPGRDAVRDFFHNRGLHRTTPYCLAEALSAFKLKWRRDLITRDEYIHCVSEFFRLVVSHLEEDEVPFAVQLRAEAERLIKAHDLDFIDAIQLVTILRGKYSVLVGDSQSLFITDKVRDGQASAALAAYLGVGDRRRTTG